MAEIADDQGAAGGSPANIDQQIAAANAALGNSPYQYAYNDPTMSVDQVPNPNYNPSAGPGGGGYPYGGSVGSNGAMTQYEAATIADAKAKLAEQQREFDAKQAQELSIFQQQQHTEEEKLQFAREQEQNKVKFQYAQLAQAQQQFEENLGWDKTKFYTEFGLNVTKEQDQAVQAFRDTLMKEQGTPQDLVSYLYNIRGYTAPAGGQSQQMPLPPSVLAAYQAQGIPIPGSQQPPVGGQNYQFLGNLPFGFGGGAGNMPPPPGQQPSATTFNAIPGQQGLVDFTKGVQQTPPPPPVPGSQPNQNASMPLGGGMGGNMLGYLTQFGANAAQQFGQQPSQLPVDRNQTQQQGGLSNFNVWNYLPPQLQGFFTPNALIGNQPKGTPNLPGTSSTLQPQAIIPSAQMYNQLTPTEQGALQSFQSQQLGVMPNDMKSMMDKNAPIANNVLTPTNFQ